MERSRWKANAWTSSEALAGLAGFGLGLAPFGSVVRSVSTAASVNTLGILTDPGQATLLVLGLFAVLALNALFVAGETSIQLLRPAHLRIQEDGRVNQRVLRDLIDSRDRVIAACVLGAQTMRAWLLFLCLIPAHDLAVSLGWSDPDRFSLWPLVGTTVLLSLPVVGLNVILSELVAKNFAALRPDVTALRLNGLLKFFAVVFRAPAEVAMRIAGILTVRFGTSATFMAETRAEEEIRGLLDTYKETGEIEQEEQTMLNSVFEFGDTVAREIMTPRVDVDSVPLTMAVGELTELILRTGHSRFPVFEATDDQIIGIVHAKDILAALARNEGAMTLADMPLRPALFVPENKPLHDLLAEMKAQKAQLVIVQDEHGGTAGIVTVEDIVEEVVGEIVDEYDAEETTVRSDADGHVVNGRMHLDDVNEAIGTMFNSDEFDTVGGYVFGLFGRQPSVGESVEHGGYRLTVVETDGRRIEAVRVSVVEEASPFDSEVLSEPAG
jgi:putative hemolysin